MMDCELPPGGCNSTGHMSTIGRHTLPGRMHHSTSTPAGVDGAGGVNRTPPATPKKGGKMLAVRVQMLDDTISMFQVQSKALGRVLFDQVCKQLHLLEADYFGLEFQDANGTKYWLDMEKPLCRQVGLSLLEPTLRFCVKFYTPDPARLEEEFTRYLFCLQVKRDLANGYIHCNENSAALMASYIVQAECGDFVPEDYPDHTYLSGYKFFPGQNWESERRIMENHKKLIGQSPAEADLNLLETARRCELYGIKMHPARDHENVPLNLAVAHMGIVVFQNFTKINTFSWAKIRKISFKRKRFLIKLHPESYGYFREVVEFFLEGRDECKNFWKKCVEYHGFFRCVTVARLPRQRTRVMSRGSSFRYSGKTQRQIVDFVRDNYMQRQTFQRSGSFRASRSLRSSRANVSERERINASVSAHPLLPLPPGSDAISLEWDKQPHYLEASLMMRGYSSEAARQAVAAAGAPRRSSEGARPPLAHTTCATMRDKPTAPELVIHAEVNHHPMEDSPLPHRTMTPLTSPENTWSRASTRLARATDTVRAPTPPPRAPPRTPEDDSTEDNTISSASMCVSPRSDTSEGPLPLYASTPLAAKAPEVATSCNGLNQLDNSKKGDANSNYENVRVNGNSHDDTLVAESTNSIDVLSGGESDADTLSRTQQNNNSLPSGLIGTLQSVGVGTMTTRRKSLADVTYYIARELLMTERTYKRDLELVTVTWSLHVSALASKSEDGSDLSELVEALGRPCLALEPLALAQGAFLAKLERCLAPPLTQDKEGEQPEYKKIGEILFDHLSNIFEWWWGYVWRAGALAARTEAARRSSGVAAEVCRSIQGAPRAHLPLAHYVLRPLHRALYYHRLAEEMIRLGVMCERESDKQWASMGDTAHAQLRHAENHAALCQLQRDILGYDKLLVAEREFLRLGCLYKHSAKGLQQRMLFLFSDAVICASKASNALQFRAHIVLALHTLTLQTNELPHSFTLTNEDNSIMLSASNDVEYTGWYKALESAIESAKENPVDIDTELTPHELDDNAGNNNPAGGGLTHVCWHRATSLSRDHLHLAMTIQVSGYLLRKFKNSHGWQKLWVVFAAFTLYFHKTWQDEKPLASLPLLGYSVGAPSESDAIRKEFVFKLQFKNHVYFFRADSQYTFNRWTEAIQHATIRTP